MIDSLRARWRYFRLMWRVFNHRGEWMIVDEFASFDDLTLEKLAEAMNRIESRRERGRP